MLRYSIGAARDLEAGSSTQLVEYEAKNKQMAEEKRLALVDSEEKSLQLRDAASKLSEKEKALEALAEKLKA